MMPFFCRYRWGQCGAGNGIGTRSGSTAKQNLSRTGMLDSIFCSKIDTVVSRARSEGVHSKAKQGKTNEAAFVAARFYLPVCLEHETGIAMFFIFFVC